MRHAICDIRKPRTPDLGTVGAVKLTSGYGTPSEVIPVGPEDMALLFFADGTVRFQHRCAPAGAAPILCAPALRWGLEHGPGHTVERAESGAVTVTPSVLCPDCKTHGFVRESTWKGVT